jgi:hypothetical protein
MIAIVGRHRESVSRGPQRFAAALAAREDRVIALLEAVKAGAVKPAEIPAAQVQAPAQPQTQKITALARAQVRGSRSDSLSLRPEGLEAGMSVLDMVDLLTFIGTPK